MNQKFAAEITHNGKKYYTGVGSICHKAAIDNGFVNKVVKLTGHHIYATVEQFAQKEWQNKILHYGTPKVNGISVYEMNIATPEESVLFKRKYLQQF